MNWYHLYQRSQLAAVPWELFKQTIRWNLEATEFILEYVNEPADKTGVMNRDEAAAYTKTSAWDDGEPWASMNDGEG